MPYTVKEVSELSGVTVKALHHYHRIGLLLPSGTTEAGYRLYGTPELERLQQILFYRELDFPLPEIGRLLEGQPEREGILTRQRKLLLERKSRLERLIGTLEATLASAKKGESMENRNLFAGFEKKEQWEEALQDQVSHLKETYGYDMLEENPIDVEEMNAQAAEAVRYMNAMAELLREGSRHDSGEARELIRGHLAFLADHGHALTPADYAAQCRFFLGDDFHRSMLEAQQTGLAYYLSAAAEAYAAA
ncbi:MerR family DNA-binding transcriptional regulator [Paenibacillus aurantius]|uniref:MerR family DNA-binding transcriptional regulator n=1 Tax=Paenibacillus aurantius TaxID=2918900 RepID=A0AA96LD96_9BACL|nr:MerR family transcriptional regulator [Paenibacillus aurantius]WNQ11093.1 MerR family DNA-binding transcriptional regulator [Paenibacillus aurantius]